MPKGIYVRSRKYKEDMSKIMTGKKKSKKHAENISLGKKGIKLLEEHIKNISKGLKGRKFSEKHIKNMSKCKIGIKHSDKTKIKISESNKGKISHRKGKTFEEEYGVDVAKAIKKKLSESRKGKFGKEAGNWQGGITSINHLLRASSKFKIWREIIFLRDNFTCQNPNCSYCQNKIGVLLNAHHIKPVALFPELAFRIDNGITYCAEFHLKSGLHKKIPKGQRI